MRTPDGQKGVRATYWNNEKFSGKPAAQVVNTAKINLDNGGNTAFTAGVNLEHFSAKYETVYTPQQDADILINVNAEDYLAVIVNGDTLFNKWNGHGVVYKSFPLNVKAGQKYSIEVDYIQDEIVSQVGDADVIVFVGGISPRLEGEEMKVNEEGFRGGDRTSIELPRVQRELMAALKQAGKRVVFVNCSGSAIAMVPEADNADAIVQAWYAGEQGGRAVADVLFGQYNPSGKLPLTFYRSTDQLPDFEDYHMANRTYRYFTGEPLFPFGYGLSYTTFRFGRPHIDTLHRIISVNVTNTGSRQGDEVVQVYLRRLDDSNGPKKTLRAFKRVSLQAGESEVVEIPFRYSDFENWDEQSNTMRVVPGRYELMVGNSSRDADLKKFTVTVK